MSSWPTSCIKVCHDACYIIPLDQCLISFRLIFAVHETDTGIVRLARAFEGQAPRIKGGESLVSLDTGFSRPDRQGAFNQETDTVQRPSSGRIWVALGLILRWAIWLEDQKLSKINQIQDKKQGNIQIWHNKWALAPKYKGMEHQRGQ